MSVLRKLNKVEEILKHQPGRHPQQRHAGERGGGNVPTVAELKQSHPGVYKAIEEIAYDNGGRPNESYQFPESAMATLDSTNQVFLQAADEKYGDVISKEDLGKEYSSHAKQWLDDDYDAFKNDTALVHLAIGEEGSQVALQKAYSKRYGDSASDAGRFLNEVFDGKYSGAVTYDVD